MELTYKTWKDEYIVYEDIHRGYDFIIKLFHYKQFYPHEHNSSHYCCYVKIPNNNKYNGHDYKNIDIEVHNGLSFSEKIDNDWWIGWDYSPCSEAFNKYDLKDVFADCCFVIKQLIEKGGGIRNNEIISKKSILSKEISDYISNINKEKPDDIIGKNNKCINCGNSIQKSTASENRLKQIADIKAKIPNIDKEIDRVFSTDVNLALKLLGKNKKYYNEIKKIEEIENDEMQRTICEKCYNEFVEKNIVELLELYKNQCLKLNELEFRLYLQFTRFKCPNEKINHNDEYKDIFNETINNLKNNLQDKLFYEYHEAMFLYISKYYYKALISFQNILNKYNRNEYNQGEKFDYYTAYKRGMLTEEEMIIFRDDEQEHGQEYEQEYENMKAEVIYDITEKINEIKEILEID